MGKPRVFIGSSTEGLEVAKAVEVNLKDDTEPVLWSGDVFGPSQTTIESLEKALDTVEFAVLVASPDDLLTKRQTSTEVPRDNVLFELGLFMGRLGRERTFLVSFKERGMAPGLPTDLLGMTVVTVDNLRSNGDMAAALRPELYKVLHTIKKARRQQPAEGRQGDQSFLLDRDQFLDAIASWPTSSKAITIALPDTAWAWELFPTLLCWRLTKTPVLVYALPPRGNADKIKQEQSRRELLRKLGIKVEEVQNIEKAGAFRKTDSVEEDSVIICNEDALKGVPFAIQYDGMIHSQAVISLIEGVAMPQGGLDAGSIPWLEGYDVKDVIERLRKGVHQYSSPGVDLRVSKIKTTDLYLMSSFVRSFKYRQIDLLFNEYQRLGIVPFQTMAVRLPSGGNSIVTPPIVEVHDDNPIVIGGTTRTKFSCDRKIPTFHCIEVTGVHDPLPGSPVPLEQVSISKRSLEPAERMENFDYRLFRHIEKAVRPY